MKAKLLKRIRAKAEREIYVSHSDRWGYMLNDGGKNYLRSYNVFYNTSADAERQRDECRYYYIVNTISRMRLLGITKVMKEEGI